MGTDQMIARYMAEIEERKTFVDGIFTAADGKDLSRRPDRARQRHQASGSKRSTKIEPLVEMRRISGAGHAGKPADVEYRSAGEYVLDYWRPGLGIGGGDSERLDMYNRAAAHQTTSGQPRPAPDPGRRPRRQLHRHVRPLTTWLGARQIPSNTWTRPKVTQHTNVAVQPVGEKNELVSQKMLISKQTVTANTYGGYVNVSRQDIDWTQPSIMDIVINDLAGKYGVVTEAALCAALVAGATAGTTIPTGTPTTTAGVERVWAPRRRSTPPPPDKAGWRTSSPRTCSRCGRLCSHR
jgi:HK97 family phage major capsid protein